MIGDRLLSWGRPAQLATLTAALTAYAGVALTNSRIIGPDTYLNLYAGRWIVDHRAIPHTDTLTFAGQGRPWFAQQWLPHVLFYATWRVGGYAAIAILSGASIALAFAILAWLMLRRGTSPTRTITWVVVAFFVCQQNTEIRAQSFAYPLFAGVLFLLLEDERQGWRNRMWALLPLLILWSNVHGSILLGAPLVAGYCLWRLLKTRDLRYGALVAATPITVGITPYGFSVFDYYQAVVSNPVIGRVVQEWAPATFSPSNLQFFILCLLLAAIAVVAVRKRVRPAPGLVAITLILIAGGFHTVRYQAWAAFPGVVLAAEILSQATAPSEPASRKPLERSSRLLTALPTAMLFTVLPLAVFSPDTVRAQVFLIFAGVVAGAAVIERPRAWRGTGAALGLVCAVATAMLVVGGHGIFAPEVSPGASRALAAFHADYPHAAVLADDETSGAVLWQTPELQGEVGYDPRVEIVPQKSLTLYANFLLGQGRWLAVTKPYSFIVVSRADHPVLEKRMDHAPGWVLAYHDQTDAIYASKALVGFASSTA